jgi:hypothetical protein
MGRFIDSICAIMMALFGAAVVTGVIARSGSCAFVARDVKAIQAAGKCYKMVVPDKGDRSIRGGEVNAALTGSASSMLFKQLKNFVNPIWTQETSRAASFHKLGCSKASIYATFGIGRRGLIDSLSFGSAETSS